MNLTIMINVALDAMGMAVIATLMCGALLSNQMAEKRGRMIVLLLALIFVQQASDLVNWLCEAKPAYAELLLFVNFIIFTVADITALVFYYYVLTLLSGKTKAVSRLTVVLTVLCGVYILLNLINLRTFSMYGVDENGCYFRGPLYLVSHIYHFAAMLIGVVVAMLDKEMSKSHKLALFTYAFMPLIALVFQLFVYGLSSITYCTMTLSMLLIYVTVHVHSVARLEQVGLELSQTRKAYQETLNDAATDDLTGVLVRKVLTRQVEETLQTERTHGCALWMLDLDHFKQVNDRFGHAMGDEVLRAVADRLISLFPQGTAVARYGGDEFCVFLNQLTLDETYQYLQHAQTTLDFLCQSGTKPVKVTASIGAAFAAPDSSVTPEELFAKADQALYNAKNNGRHQYALIEM